MIVRRVGAAALAILMIVGAVVWRSHRDLDKGPDAPRSDGEKAVLVCASELERICKGLPTQSWGVEVVIEPAATTEAALGGATDDSAVDFDVWLTAAPLPEMVAAERSSRSLPAVTGDRSAVIASSPLALIVWNDRLAVLREACDTPEVSWRCIGEISGTPWADHGGDPSWGPVKPGLDPPSTTATGLFTIAQASASWLGRPDYASNDFDDIAFQQWLRQLARGAPNSPIPPRTPLDDMLSKGSATFDLTGEPAATARSRISASRDKDRLEMVYPAEPVMFDVVAVPVTGSSGGSRVVGLLTSPEAAAVLAAAGWDTGSDITTTTGLPGPGVLQALRTLWKQVA